MKEVMEMKHIKLSTAVKYGALLTLIAVLALTTTVSAQTPQLSRIVPNRWTADFVSTVNLAGGDATFTFTLFGANFDGNSRVLFTCPDGFVYTVPVANTNVVSLRQLRVLMPRSWLRGAAAAAFTYRRPLLNLPGTASFQVTGNGGTSSRVALAITAPKPTVLTINPQPFFFRSPVGGASYDTVTITGRNFVENAVVRFRGPGGFALDVPTVDTTNNLRPGVYGMVNPTGATFGLAQSTITIFSWNGTSANIGAGTPGTVPGSGSMIDDWNDGYLFPSNSPPGVYTVSVVNSPNQESNRRNVIFSEAQNNPSLNPLTAIPARWSVTTAATGITTVTGGPFATGAQIWARNGSTFGNPLPPNPTNVPMTTTYIDSRTLTCPNVTNFLYGTNPGPFGVAGTNVRVWVVQPAPGGGNGPVQNNWPLI